MKITICGSMKFAKKIKKIKDKLEKLNHEIIIPRNTELYADGSLPLESKKESIENKIKYNLLKLNFDLIKSSILNSNLDLLKK